MSSWVNLAEMTRPLLLLSSVVEWSRQMVMISRLFPFPVVTQARQRPDAGTPRS